MKTECIGCAHFVFTTQADIEGQLKANRVDPIVGRCTHSEYFGLVRCSIHA